MVGFSTFTWVDETYTPFPLRLLASKGSSTVLELVTRWLFDMRLCRDS